MSASARSPFTRTEFVVGVLALMLLFALLTAACGNMKENNTITKSILNCRQILLSIREYASDSGGRYPDSAVPNAKDSNTVFRQLIIAGSLEDEKIFGAGESPFVPDGVIGTAPDFAQAIEPNENHWAMTKGVDDSSPGGVPLVFENPVDPTWPPTWNVDAYGAPIKGKSRRSKIIIGTNDTAVEMMVLASGQGTHVPLKKLGDEGLDIFTAATRDPKAPKYEVLDIAWDEQALADKLTLDRAKRLTAKIALVVAALLVGALLLAIARRMLRKFNHPVRPAQY